jgi:uncharacterized protein
MKIFIKTSTKTFSAELNSCATACAIASKLPITAKAEVWGEEIYFRIPIKCKPENATMDVNVGDIAYWPPGACLCLFFGQTPESTGAKPVPASEVNIVGRIAGNLSALKGVKEGDTIKVEDAKEASEILKDLS